MRDVPVGHVIRNARRQAGMTQTALAGALGVSVSYVNLIEHDRRQVRGKRLKDITTILNIDPKALDGETEARLLTELEEVSSDPALAGLDLDWTQVRSLVARYEPWAHALVALYRAGQRDQSLIAAFSDRLNHDPVLNESIHKMLNASTAIHSVTTILNESAEISAEQRVRFDSILGEEATRLAGIAQSLAGFFERNEQPGTALTAPEEVDEFLFERRNYFPDIEERIEQIRKSLDHDALPSTPALVESLEEDGISVRRLPLTELPETAHRLTYFDGKTLLLAEGLPRATERFEIARRITGLKASDIIEAELERAPNLTSNDARNRAKRALHAYAAAALLMPYDKFFEATKTTRYDIDALAMAFNASPEQLCHRFTSLRRPGAEGVPFAFLRANAAGYLTKRFPLPRLPMPRFGGACPLWAVYAAMQTPDLRQRQLAEFPNGDRFFIIARATRPVAGGFGKTLPGFSLMLACDALNADRLVYSDGLNLSSTAQAEPVGPTCLLCPREHCAHRQEPSARAK